MSKKILLVEDDTFLSEIYITKFEQAGYDISVVHNGGEAVKKMKELKTDSIYWYDKQGAVRPELQTDPHRVSQPFNLGQTLIYSN